MDNKCTKWNIRKLVVYKPYSGIRDEKAKELMEKNDIKYIENKCTKMEYQKYFLKVRQAFPVLSD